MAQGTMEPQTRSDRAADPGSIGEIAESATSVAEVRLRTAAELEMSSWERSVGGPVRGSAEQVQFFMDLHRSNPEACHQMAEAATVWPEASRNTPPSIAMTPSCSVSIRPVCRPRFSRCRR